MKPVEAPAGTGLGDKAARGVAWTTVDAIGSRLITTVVFVLLARMLPPAAFGLVALSLTFIALTRLLVDQGFGIAIVQRHELTKAHLDTAFWASVTTGLVLAGGLVALSAPLASLLGTPQLAPVLQALSIIVVIGAPSNTAAAVLRRTFGFRRLAARRLIAALAGGVAGVAAALAGLGVWSLVIQALVQAVVSTLSLWAVTPFKPGLRVSRSAFRELFGFSNKVIGISFVTFASKRSDDLLIGGVLGPTALGLYSVAFRLLTIATEVVGHTIDTVALSTFSKLQAELPRLRRAYETSLRLSTAIAAPTYLTSAVLAADVIDTLFGPQWAASVPVMQALSLAGLAQAVAASNNTLLLALGRARTALRLSTAYAVVSVVAFAVAVPFGIVAVAVAYSARTYLMAPLSVYQVKRHLGMSWVSWLGNFAPPVVCAVLMCAVVVPLRVLVLDGLPAPARLLVAGACAVLLYVALLTLLYRSRARELASTLRRAVPGRSGSSDHHAATGTSRDES